MVYHMEEEKGAEGEEKSKGREDGGEAQGKRYPEDKG
jgi:hypothetical protein